MTEESDSALLIRSHGRKIENIMTLRAIPVLALLVLFVASPVLACEAMARSSDTPMDMAAGCTDDMGPDGSPVLCPASSMIAPTPHVELPRDLVATAPTPFTSEAFRSGSARPPRIRSTPRPPNEVPLYKIHASYLI